VNHDWNRSHRIGKSRTEILSVDRLSSTDRPVTRGNLFCPRCYHSGRAIGENYGRNRYDNGMCQAKKEEKEKKTEKTYFGEFGKQLHEVDFLEEIIKNIKKP
jgi:hypothetical protein